MAYKIGIDASGGDNAPDEIIKGALLASRELPGEHIVLFGDGERIRKKAKDINFSSQRYSVVDAPEIIEMADSPVSAVRRKKNSSIVQGIKYLKEGSIDAFVSCGNTGAVVCASTLGLGMVEGVERPGIGLVIPTRTGVSFLIDGGANVDSRPLHLLQYGIMGSVYYEFLFNKKCPSVGLLNIGEEASKGLGMLKKLHKLFEASPLNFIGNVEPRELISGKCDCLVCDGFVGNITLKVMEASFDLLKFFLLKAMKRGILGRLGLILAGKNLKQFKKSIDYAEYGGAPLLGVDGVVIIGHGRSNAIAVKNAVRVAVGELKRGITSEIKRRVDEVGSAAMVKDFLNGAAIE